MGHEEKSAMGFGILVGWIFGLLVGGAIILGSTTTEEPKGCICTQEK